MARARPKVQGSDQRLVSHIHITQAVSTIDQSMHEKGESILIFRLCVGVAGIACVAVGITLAGVVGILGLLLRCLTCLDRLHLAGD